MRFLREAIRLSREKMEADEGGPFGAVIVRGDRILSRGWNRVTRANDPTAHAEICAIRAACSALDRFDLSGCTLYASCEPCPMCLGAIYWARLDAVVFAATRRDAADAGFDDAFVYRDLSQPIEARAIPFRQALREEALPVLEAWTRKEDRVDY
nr:nucleoside deaminase [Kiritimatiella glycovorans]